LPRATIHPPDHTPNLRTGALLRRPLAAACCVAVCLAASAAAGPGAGSLRLTKVVSGLESPVYVTAPPGEPGRLYVVEQPGVIRVLDHGRLLATPFLDIRPLVLAGGEQGLLSVAFHPGYARDHRFYVDYTDRNGDTRVVEYRARGAQALPDTARQLLFVDQPYPNHNGGQLQFGPDGRLYVGMGDGGSGGDPEDRAQNLGVLLGKLLRIDVDSASPAPRVAAYGLRNPWRFSFDARGDLYLGDVGQGDWEEIDYLAAGTLGRGLVNFGWNRYEGRAVYDQANPLDTRGRLVWPVAVYGHGEGCSVTGGYAYRGSAVPAMRGRYLYGDYCSGTIWSLRIVAGKATGVRREAIRLPNLSSFGEDARGELYLVSLGGSVYRLTG
jgi:glucose/arabinose dehydrogenase